jgi:hypothetical protein
MQKLTLLILVAISLLARSPSTAQHKTAGDHEEILHPHHLSVLLAVTHIPQGERGERTGIYAPTLGLEYEYELTHHWALGAAGDLEFKDYSIDINGTPVTQKNVVVLAALGIYTFTGGFQVLLGPGYSFEKNKSLFLIRAGLKYQIPLGDRWDITPTLEVDLKKKYETVALGVSIGKRF